MQKLEPGARRRRRRDAWSSGNMTQEGEVSDELGVVMGRRLRVFTPDELPADTLLEAQDVINVINATQEAYGDTVIHLDSSELLRL